MSLLDICFTVILILVGVNLKKLFSDFTKDEKKFLNRLFYYHLAITVLFHLYISYDGGDAIHYWVAPQTIPLAEIWGMVREHYATGIVYFINYFPSKVLQLSFFTGNLMYSTLGFLGFIFIFKIIKKLINDKETLFNLKLAKIKIYPWIWFLPNFHFWSSGIGKDALLFLSITMFFYGISTIKKNYILLIISAILAFAIRPHILLFLIVGVGISLVLERKLASYYKFILFMLAIGFIVLIFRYVLEFVQLENLDTSAISEYTSKRSSNLNQAQTTSGVDISEYSFPFKVFTFLYRPLFFDIKGILFLLASIENVILLLFSFHIMLNNPVKAFREAHFIIKSGLIFFVLGTLTFSLVLGNLGIMLRQKNMLIPWFVVFGIWTFYCNQRQLKER